MLERRKKTLVLNYINLFRFMAQVKILIPELNKSFHFMPQVNSFGLDRSDIIQAEVYCQ